MFRGTRYLPHSQVHNDRPVHIITVRPILHIFHCACTKWPYFHLRSTICRHHHVPRPRFPQRRENFGDSRTFKAVIGLLIFAWIFRTSWPKMRVCGQNGGKGDPQRTRFYFWGFLRLCQFWWKSIKKYHRESLHRQIHGYTDTLTDASRFFNLSHTVDKKLISRWDSERELFTTTPYTYYEIQKRALAWSK